MTQPKTSGDFPKMNATIMVKSDAWKDNQDFNLSEKAVNINIKNENYIPLYKPFYSEKDVAEFVRRSLNLYYWCLKYDKMNEFSVKFIKLAGEKLR